MQQDVDKEPQSYFKQCIDNNVHYLYVSISEIVVHLLFTRRYILNIKTL